MRAPVLSALLATALLLGGGAVVATAASPTADPSPTTTTSPTTTPTTTPTPTLEPAASPILSAPPPASAAASSPAPARAGTTRRTVRVGSTSRPYLLQHPGGTPTGALLVAHAQNQTMSQAAQTYGLEGLSRRGVVIAWLGGYGGSWNSGRCCGAARRDRVDDVGYVAAVRADVARQLPAGRPVGLMGVSSGGMLAYAVVCTRRVDLALVVSVSGTRSSGCGSARPPLRFLELHGARDRTVPLDPPSRYTPLLGVVPIPTRPAVRTLVEASGCTRRVSHGPARTDWGGCRSGVVRLLVRPAGHQYRDLGAPAVVAQALREVGAMR